MKIAFSKRMKTRSQNQISLQVRRMHLSGLRTTVIVGVSISFAASALWWHSASISWQSEVVCLASP